MGFNFGGGGQDNVDWIHQDLNRHLWQADVKPVRNILIPHNEESFLNSSQYVGFSRRSLLHGFLSLVYS